MGAHRSRPQKRPKITAHKPPDPLRRSARLQKQQIAEREVSIRSSRALPRRQIEAGPGKVTSEWAGLKTRNTQPEAKIRQKKTTEAEEYQPASLKRPSATAHEIRVEEKDRAVPSTHLPKRPINGHVSDKVHQLQRAQLTQKNLAKLDRMARKNMTSKAPVSGTPETTGTTTSATTKTSSGRDIKAYKNGILGPDKSKPPTNIEDIRMRYAARRGSASPTESFYEDYVRTVERAPNESTMVVEVAGGLLKKHQEDGYQRVFNQAFTLFPEDTGFNSGLSAPQPDFIEGVQLQEYSPFPVDGNIKGAVIYNDNRNSLVLPHIAGEWKGPGKDMKKATLQSAYDGAALVYARNQALSYMGESDPPGHAAVTTFTTDGTSLNCFAHYAAPSAVKDGTLQYHQYRFKSTQLMDSHQALKDGRRGLRNQQDHAKKQSYALRDQLNENWRKHRDALRPLAEGGPQPVADGTVGETETDEAEHVPGW